jgi:hypothetical protein
MLYHVVSMQFKPEVDEAAIKALERELDALPNQIYEIQSYEFGRDVVRSERSFDFGLVSLFANTTTLKRYQEHPEHQKVLARIRQMCRSVVTVDFEMGRVGASVG